MANLVQCLANGWCSVALKMAWGEATRGSISERGSVTEEQRSPRPFSSATLRAAVLLPWRGVARSLHPHQRDARRSRLAPGQNPLRHNTSHLRDTALGTRRLPSCLQSRGETGIAKRRPSVAGGLPV